MKYISFKCMKQQSSLIHLITTDTNICRKVAYYALESMLTTTTYQIGFLHFDLGFIATVKRKKLFY